MDEAPDGARVEPIPPKQWPEGMRTALAALNPPNPRHPFPSREPGRPKGLNILGTLAHHPDLATAYHTFNGHILFGTTLSTRQRELIVLRVAAVRDAPYEWAQHVVLAGDVGISEDEVTAIVDDPRAASWSPIDAAILSAVDELIADATIGDATWAVLAAGLEVEQLMDLIFTVGAYEVLAMLMNGFRVPLDDDLQGIRPLRG